ncbi:hypothetical protein GJ496_010400 [Pomphorhynchus laevis]|nr:hypothetical protein GJ496_010400 [Pomphorhynchus laevis]
MNTPSSPSITSSYWDDKIAAFKCRRSRHIKEVYGNIGGKPWFLIKPQMRMLTYAIAAGSIYFASQMFYKLYKKAKA